MELIEVSAEVYHSTISDTYHLYGSSFFNQINEYKTDKIHYLLFKDNKYRLGIIGCFKSGVFISPFSAPFGGFSYVSSNIRIQCIEHAIDLLKTWVAKNNSRGIEIVLPPTIYNESFISKQSNALYRSGFTFKNVDLNYSFKTSEFAKTYKDRIWRNAKKALNISHASNLRIKICDHENEKHEAYKIIQENRKLKGFPLKMQWSDIEKTICSVNSDFFIVIDEHDNSIASAIAFHVSPLVVQIIYWGDRPGFSNVNPMNFISFKIFEYYSEVFDYIDIGPSTENSIPNFGLCEFKESIGCQVQNKFTFAFYV